MANLNEPQKIILQYSNVNLKKESKDVLFKSIDLDKRKVK